MFRDRQSTFPNAPTVSKRIFLIVSRLSFFFHDRDYQRQWCTLDIIADYWNRFVPLFERDYLATRNRKKISSDVDEPSTEINSRSMGIFILRVKIVLVEYMCIRTKEIIAANRRILTRRSSNCSRTSCHMDFPEISKQKRIKSCCSAALIGKVHLGRSFR